MFPFNLNTLPAGAQELISELALEPIALYGENDYGRLWYKFADSDEISFISDSSFREGPESSLYLRTQTQRSNFIRERQFVFLDYYQLSLF